MRIAPPQIRPVGIVLPGVADAPDQALDESVQAFDDGLDPAFDEVGDLHDHVDGLSSWLRRGRAHPRWDDE